MSSMKMYWKHHKQGPIYGKEDQIKYVTGFPGGSDVKNLSALWETWVLSLGWEDPLEESMATHSSILAWRLPMDRGAW